MTHTEIVAILKKELKGGVDGKFMVRQNKTYQGEIQQGIYRYNIHFDNPTPHNKEVITGTVAAMSHLGVRVVSKIIIESGAYGYRYIVKIEPAK